MTIVASLYRYKVNLHKISFTFNITSVTYAHSTDVGLGLHTFKGDLIFLVTESFQEYTLPVDPYEACLVLRECDQM